MKKILLSALVVSSALVACAANVGDGTDLGENAAAPSEDTAATSEALTTVGVGGTGGIGGSGTITAPLPVPRVLSRSASGSQLVFNFDRAVTAAEIPFSLMHVDVVRRVNGNFQTANLFQSAVLSADGRSLTMKLTEPLKKGTAYYARGRFKTCMTIPGIPGIPPICRTYGAEFGQVVATSSSPVVVNGGIFTDFTELATRRMFMALEPSVDAARITKVALAEDLPAPSASVGPGTFRVKSMNPIQSSEANKRDIRTITVQFEGGTVDCTKIAAGEAGFKLWSRSPDVNVQQLMFDDPAHTNPSDALYRGHLVCDVQDNQIRFTPPGILLGDMQYMVEGKFTSKEGDELAIEKDFYTERPGVRVTALRVENHYGTHDTCDSDGIWGSDNYCDVYVTSASAVANNAQTARIPETGDFSEMRMFENDPVLGAKNLPYPGKVLFQSASAVGEVLALDLVAMDADDTSAWKKILAVAGDVATKSASTLATIEPKAGAIAVLTGVTLSTISAAIPENEDDQMGSFQYTRTRGESRWGTTAGVQKVSLTNNGSRGPVVLDVVHEEYPTPWHLPAGIDIVQ
jgi:hypothetical protein